MRSSSKLFLTGLLATIAMTFAVSSASASRLSISNRNIRVVWTSLDLISGTSTLIQCPVTLEGSFHSATLRKTQGALIGFISRASVRSASCTGGGGATILTETLPWHITYDSFTGSLPRPTSVVLLLAETPFNVSLFGVNCLFGEDGTTRARGATNIEPNGLVTGLTPDPTTELPLLVGGFLCPEEGRFGDIGRVTLLGSSTQNISVRLI